MYDAGVPHNKGNILNCEVLEKLKIGLWHSTWNLLTLIHRERKKILKMHMRTGRRIFTDRGDVWTGKGEWNSWAPRQSIPQNVLRSLIFSEAWYLGTFSSAWGRWKL